MLENRKMVRFVNERLIDEKLLELMMKDYWRL
jgi:hypothetical protein